MKNKHLRENYRPEAPLARVWVLNTDEVKTEIPEQEQFNTPGITSITDTIITLTANTLNSVTITCTEGETIVDINKSPVVLKAGQTVSWTATTLLALDIKIECATTDDAATISTLSGQPTK